MPEAICRQVALSITLLFGAMCALHVCVKLRELNDLIRLHAALSTAYMTRMHLWIRGLLAEAISGASGGVPTGFAVVGIDRNISICRRVSAPTMRIGMAATITSTQCGVAAYLQKSPLPEEMKWRRPRK